MKEVTEVLRISRNTVVKEIESNNLKAMKFGKQYRFKKCDIMNYISQYTTVKMKVGINMMKNRLKNLIIMISMVVGMSTTFSNVAHAYTQDELIAIWKQEIEAAGLNVEDYRGTGGVHTDLYIGNSDSNISSNVQSTSNVPTVETPAPIPVHEHKYTANLTTDPTCTTEGIITYTCSCGDKYTESQPKLEHVYESKVSKEATCTEEGETTYTCTLCGDTYTESISAIGHEEGASETTKNPTCTEAGEKSIHCKNCGEILRTEEIEATGHTAGESMVEKEVTLFEEGEKVTRCTVCDEIIDSEVIPVNTTMRNTVIGVIAAVVVAVVVVIVVVLRKRKSSK